MTLEMFHDILDTLPHDKQGCQFFPNSKRGRYRKVSVDGKMCYAHRLSLQRKLGRLIEDDKIACHIKECNEKSCVNPDHIYEGTYMDNTLDMVELGRHGSWTHPERWVRGDDHWTRRRKK
jgi:hypothetical protein